MNVNYEQKIDGLIRGWERDHIQHDWTSALGQLGNVGTSEWPIIRDTYTRVRKNIVAENVSLSVSETATVPVPETAVAVAQPESQPSAKSEPVIESDPFVFTDADRAEFLKAERPELGLIPSVRAAIDKGFHVFALTLKDKVPLPGSNGFKDSKSPSDP